MTTDAPETSSPWTFRKRMVYGPIVSIVSVILFFSVLEGALRLVSFGHSALFYRIQTLEDGSRIYRENRNFAFPYFQQSVIRRPQSFRLNYSKPDTEYRVFLLGSSAAMGDPEASFSIARILELMLEEAYDGLDFEVVNAAMTAINSHVVRRIAEDCTRLEPDLFIVYEGNNEVIGPFGPTGVLTPFLGSEAAIDALIGLRSSRTGQLLNALTSLGNRSGEPEGWGGMQMFLHQKITRDDPRLDDVERFFIANLRDIVRSGESKGIPTLLCTVLTNQRDFAPFQSDHAPGLSDTRLNEWNQLVETGDHAWINGDLVEAENAYQQAWAIDDSHAALAFKLGRIYLQQNDDVRAGVFLRLALDLDSLRFRTDSRLNNAIRNKIALSNPLCSAVDLEKIFSAASPQKILGDEWLYEHVHLNFYANYQIAGVLFKMISKQLLEEGRIDQDQAQLIDYEVVVKMLGYTLYEQGLIANELLNRFENPPFTAQIDHAARLSAWRERVTKLDRALSDPAVRERIIQDYESALSHRSSDWVLQRNFGMALLSFGLAERAVAPLEKALGTIDDDPDTLFSLGIAYYSCERITDAGAMFQKLQTLEPRYPGLGDWLKKQLIN